jgi:hypothetical protein
MQLLKVKNGLLEKDNFYMTSSFEDFLGTSTTHRDGDSFFIDGNETIERLFPYQNFLLELKKENWNPIEDDDRILFYVSDSVDLYGIVEDNQGGTEQTPYLRIVVIDGYIQTYASLDGITWENIGGADLYGKVISKQGFKKDSSKSFKMLDYHVYSSPFLTIQNFPENYKAELYDTANTLLKERLFDSNSECQIYLDYNLEGYFKIYDPNGIEVFTSSIMQFSQGDIFVACEFELELIYKEVVLPKDEITEMGTYGSGQRVTLRNISTSSTYTNLLISTEIESTDTIELSFDNINYSPTLTVPSLAPNGEVDIYVMITRGDGTTSFVTREFMFKVE